MSIVTYGGARPSDKNYADIVAIDEEIVDYLKATHAVSFCCVPYRRAVVYAGAETGKIAKFYWCRVRGLNSRPTVYKTKNARKRRGTSVDIFASRYRRSLEIPAFTGYFAVLQGTRANTR